MKHWGKKTETENYQQNQLLFKETGNTHTNFGIKQKNCKKKRKKYVCMAKITNKPNKATVIYFWSLEDVEMERKNKNVCSTTI